MKIAGVGVDIVDVAYFKRRPYKSKVNLYNKIFTAEEIKYCLTKDDSYQHFAVRCAAKEAVIKAGGLKLANINSIEIFNDKTGRPHARVKKRKISVLISLSHAKNYAVAFVIWLN
mgnify:CR=1 FL=1